MSAKCKGSVRHYPGKIFKRNDDGSFDIKFDDGDRDKAVPKRYIKPSESKSPRRERDRGSTSEDEGGFAVGEKVSAKCKGSVRHYPGKIFKKNDDGSFDIKFDDGDRDRAVPKRSIKPSESKSPRRARDRGSTSEDEGSFAVGDEVTAKCKGSLRYYPGKIYKKNDDGSFDIKFDDGDRDRAVPKRSIKAKNSEKDESEPSKSSSKRDTARKGSGTFEYGDKVTARCRGSSRYYPGKVHSINSDGTYDIKFDDGDRDRSVPEKSIKSKNQERKAESDRDDSDGDKIGVGDKVEAMYKSSKRYYPGKIHAKNRNGTFVIKFNDGERDREVPKLNIKVQSIDSDDGRTRPKKSTKRKSVKDNSSGSEDNDKRRKGVEFHRGDRICSNWFRSSRLSKARAGSSWKDGKILASHGDGTYSVSVNSLLYLDGF